VEVTKEAGAIVQMDAISNTQPLAGARKTRSYSEEDESESDSFLRELEDDPMSHLADYNFSHTELQWIKKHYGTSSKFLLSYGLKPFDEEDCNSAKAIIVSLMATE
jgi:hypothetical protein